MRAAHCFSVDYTSVYRRDQPELYERAEGALLYGKGLFVHSGCMWEVLEGEGLLGDYLNIRRTADRAGCRLKF